jgi:FAD/FMN-containing dehydrogenase
MSLADELKVIVRGEVLDSPDVLEAMSRDTSLFKIRPAVVVRPADAHDVESLVTFVSSRKKDNPNLSITARAAGTDMSGGVLTDSIVLDTVHLNKVIEVMADPDASVGAGYAVTEPGVFFRDFDVETKKKNLEMPGYPASRNLAAVGGMVANDAGGEKNLKYGKTSRYVEELNVVLADGKAHTLKELKNKELRIKLEEQSFEGELYRKVAGIVSQNHDVIMKAKPDVKKNSSGYALWDIGDGVNALDLARLFAGSQGTLGIITKIRFGLVRPKPYSSMLVIFLKDFAQLGTIVPEVLAEKPDSFESYDNHTFSIALKYFPELAVQMKAGIIELGFQLLPEMWMLATGGVPKMVLLAEFRSDSQEETLGKATTLKGKIAASGAGVQMRIAKNERASRKFWTIRRESFNLLRKKIRGKRTAPFIDDFVVRPDYLPEFLPKLTAILAEYKNDMTYTIAGHVGDGNLHVLPLIDPKHPRIREIMGEMAHKVYDLVLSYRGSISGEHNDGYIRTPYLEKMFGPKMCALFGDVKHAFDPLGIFNPGKKVGITFAEAAKHLDLPA